MTSERYRVVIRCQGCGEKFILRGSRNQAGEFETGFVRCICGNEDKIHMDIMPE